MAIKKIYYNGSVFEPLTPTETQKKAVDSGITAEKVTSYDGLQAKIDEKQNKLDRTIKLIGDVTGTVTDKGGNLEISTSQDPDNLEAVLTQGNISSKSIILSDTTSTNTNTITNTKITLVDNSNHTTEISPSKIVISSDAGNFTLDFTNGFSVTASDGVSEAFRGWLEVLPQTDEITSVGFYTDASTASAAPNGTLAFYPETE